MKPNLTVTAKPEQRGLRSLLAGEKLEQRAAKVLTGLWIVGILLPIFSLVAISFAEGQGMTLHWSKLSVRSYSEILVDYRLELILRTIRIVLSVTAIEFLLAFPFALWLAKGVQSKWAKSTLLVLLVVPFFLSPAARTIVWRPVLGREGIINSLIMMSGISDSPIDWLLFSSFSIHLGLVGAYFPSMVWPLFISLSLIDDDLLHASRDLGAATPQTLRLIMFPLAWPGIVAGFIFTAVPMLGDNVVTTLLGGGKVSLIAENFDDMIGAMNFTGAAALASVMIVGIVAAGALFSVLSRQALRFRTRP